MSTLKNRLKAIEQRHAPPEVWVSWPEDPDVLRGPGGQTMPRADLERLRPGATVINVRYAQKPLRAEKMDR